MSGLDVIGSVASVLQLAATVYSISKTLYEVGDALSNAPSDIKDLARDLETFSEELHLLSTLLNGRNTRYSDRVYKLTAKIIGDCATICQKIDRLLKKLRSGSFMARVKWVYKEKEILKLLMRLRDLKLSLMGTLSLLSALKADTMMDAMGVGTKSLLEGARDKSVAEQAAKDMEDARQKLAGIAIEQDPASALIPQPSWNSGASQATTVSSSHRKLSSRRQRQSAVQDHNIAANTNPFVSFMVSPAQDFPKANPVMRNAAAMGSVQSFHTAQSSLEEEDIQREAAPESEPAFAVETMSTSTGTTSQFDNMSDKILYKKWKNETVQIGIKHFHMTEEQAITWAASVPVPDVEKLRRSSTLYDAGSILKKYPGTAGDSPQELSTSAYHNPWTSKPVDPQLPAILIKDAPISTQSLLLASKSNNQNVLYDEKSYNASYPEQSTSLMSVRTSHKIAESGRRNRINSALQEMSALLPKQDESQEDNERPKPRSNSKASVIEQGIEYIKALKQTEQQLQAISKAPAQFVSSDETVGPLSSSPSMPRPRRRYENIERTYKCSWEGCAKAFYSVDQLNAHATTQLHGHSPEELQEDTSHKMEVEKPIPSEAPATRLRRSTRTINRRLSLGNDEKHPMSKGHSVAGDTHKLSPPKPPSPPSPPSPPGLPSDDAKVELPAFEYHSISGTEAKKSGRPPKKQLAYSHARRSAPTLAEPRAGAPARRRQTPIILPNIQGRPPNMEVVRENRVAMQRSEILQFSSVLDSQTAAPPPKKRGRPSKIELERRKREQPNPEFEDLDCEDSESALEQSLEGIIEVSTQAEGGVQEVAGPSIPDGQAYTTKQVASLQRVPVSPLRTSPEYTVPGAYFSPLSSPALRPQDGTIAKHDRPQLGHTSPQIQGAEIDLEAELKVSLARLAGPRSELEPGSEEEDEEEEEDHLLKVPHAQRHSRGKCGPKDLNTIISSEPASPIMKSTETELSPFQATYSTRKKPRRLTSRPCRPTPAPHRQATSEDIPKSLSGTAYGATHDFYGFGDDIISKSTAGFGSLFGLDTELLRMDEKSAEQASAIPLANSALLENLEDKPADLETAASNPNISSAVQNRPNLSANDNIRRFACPSRHVTPDRAQNVPDQLTQLWCRSCIKLEKCEVDVASRLSAIWHRATNAMPSTAADYEIAASFQQGTDLILKFSEESLQLRQTETGIDPLLSSVGRLRDIMKVIRETLNFKVGALVWVCLCEAIMTVDNSKSNEKQNSLSALADLATLVARYNVMESMYQQWSGMTLEAKYEESLLSLCMLVLQCIDNIINMSSSSEFFDPKVLQTCMDKVNEADATCRNFSVTFLDSAMDHEIEDLSDSDSDTTVRHVQGIKRTLEEAESAADLDGNQSGSKVNSRAKRRKI